MPRSWISFIFVLFVVVGCGTRSDEKHADTSDPGTVFQQAELSFYELKCKGTMKETFKGESYSEYKCTLDCLELKNIEDQRKGIMALGNVLELSKKALAMSQTLTRQNYLRAVVACASPELTELKALESRTEEKLKRYLGDADKKFVEIVNLCGDQNLSCFENGDIKKVSALLPKIEAYRNSIKKTYELTGDRSSITVKF
ncbi:MAG: hypothetical protein IPL83_04035 [Bdellovibrionales bacterium]|nr:hypothetical protein [Bdellovibrionales bacterium]